MKTKIVYISGGDAFDVADVRGAFDEVRKALGLGEDTVLFGVPVDSDGVAVESREQRAESRDNTEMVVKPKKTRKTKAEKLEIKEEPAETPITDRVIPILSVLSGGKTEAPYVEESRPQPVQIATEVIEEVEEVWSADLNEALPDTSKTPKTIEDIFENLKPLAQEKIIESPRTCDESARDADLDDDATLNRLAAEFVETVEAPVPEPSARGGRMGKLKNILPFKKAKKDESSMLGDLFGWAGIAANDDEIQAPGFFASR